MAARLVVLRALGLLITMAGLIALTGPDLPAALSALRDPQRVVDTQGADTLVLQLLQIGLVALCGWCALCVLAVTGQALRPSTFIGRIGGRLVPRHGHRLLAAVLGLGTLSLAACGTTAGSGSAASPSTAPAYAASSDAFDWGIAQPATAPEAAGGNAGATTGAPYLPGPAVSATAASAGASHVVAPGDCLWSVAASRLGPGATPAEIAYLVDELYRLNQHAIGSDADLLPVGVILTLPTDLPV